MTPATPATETADTGELTPLLVCSYCGTIPAARDQALARLTWSRSIDRGRASWSCNECSRNNLRSIESKLDTDWW